MQWEGYEEKEKVSVTQTPIQTEKTLLGFGKPLPESQVTPLDDELKLRQVPHDSNVRPVKVFIFVHIYKTEVKLFVFLDTTCIRWSAFRGLCFVERRGSHSSISKCSSQFSNRTT